MAAMKENTRKIFDFLKAHNGEDLTAADVAAPVGLEKRQVDGSFTSFQKKGWGIREEAEREEADGSHSKVKFLRLTQDGLNYDPDAEEA